jgi:hypothetical protein
MPANHFSIFSPRLKMNPWQDAGISGPALESRSPRRKQFAASWHDPNAEPSGEEDYDPEPDRPTPNSFWMPRQTMSLPAGPSSQVGKPESRSADGR